MYKFNYEVSKEDFIQYRITHYLFAPVNAKVRKTTKKVMLLFLIMLGLILSLLFKGTGRTMAFTFVLPIIVLVICACKYYLMKFEKITIKSIKDEIENAEKFGKLPFSKDLTLTFYPGYILQETENGESKFFYHSIETIFKDKNAIYLYLNVAQAIILPYKVFLGPEEIREFQDFLETKLVSRKKKGR